MLGASKLQLCQTVFMQLTFWPTLSNPVATIFFFENDYDNNMAFTFWPAFDNPMETIWSFFRLCANQKHLLVCVTNNILEAEDNQDRICKFLFSKNHVPLYLVREFEQKPGVTSLPTIGIVSLTISPVYTKGE